MITFDTKRHLKEAKRDLNAAKRALNYWTYIAPKSDKQEWAMKQMSLELSWARERVELAMKKIQEDGDNVI